MAGERYDIFISYASEDRDWVQRELYEPLCRCLVAGTGRKVQVFFDRARLQTGDSFHQRFEEALEASHRFVPVYSRYYFTQPKKVCEDEFDMALVLRSRNRQDFIMGIEIQDGWNRLIANTIQYASAVKSPSTWFAELCRALGLQPVKHQQTLTFVEQPKNAQAGLTLPAVSVTVRTSGPPTPGVEDEIVMAAESGDPPVPVELQGGVRQKTSGGVAAFKDLLIPQPAAGIRLVASASGMDSVRSQPFNVVAPAPPPPPAPSNPPTIVAEGESEAVFFASGKAVLLFRPGMVAVYDLAGRPLLPSHEVTLTGRVRLVARSGSQIVIADWGGNVWLFSDDGRSQSWAFAGGKGGFVVPGGIAFDGETAYVGFWSGLVFEVSLAGSAHEVLRHEAGVQALAVVGGRCYIADFGGALKVYNLATRMLVNAGGLEAAIWLLRPSAAGLMAIGDQYAYQITLSPFQIHREALPPGATAGVFAETARPVLVGEDGRGLRVDPGLVFRPRFRVPPGVVPVGADELGTYCVCAAPDGRRTVLRDSKVIYSHPAGTVAVSPGGDRFALGEQGGVRVIDAATFGRLVQGVGA